jgi:hypothetical protein
MDKINGLNLMGFNVAGFYLSALINDDKSAFED